MRGPRGRQTHYRRISVNGGAFGDCVTKTVKFARVNLEKHEIFAFMGCYMAFLVVNDVSGQPIRPIFKSQELQEE
jgi:hypothetical protein